MQTNNGNFKANLLVPRPLNLHKNTNKQQKITFYTFAKSHKLFICERHFTVDQIYVYSSCKWLREGAWNLPHPSANANATNNWSKRAIEKLEQYALLQEQIP